VSAAAENLDAELEAMKSVINALNGLSHESCRRVMATVIVYFDPAEQERVLDSATQLRGRKWR
jgi:hypothetical protein